MVLTRHHDRGSGILWSGVPCNQSRFTPHIIASLCLPCGENTTTGGRKIRDVCGDVLRRGFASRSFFTFGAIYALLDDDGINTLKVLRALIITTGMLR